MPATTGRKRTSCELDAAGRAYIDLIRDHIGKEDHVLFEMADGLLEGPPCQRVCRAYHEICSRRFDGRTHADLEALATSLLEAYPPPKFPETPSSY